MPAPMPMPDRPAHILETALYAADLDAAEGFYGGVLGLERAARAGDRHVFFRLAGAMLLIFNPAETERPPTGLPVPPHGARGPGHLAFAASATDLDAWRARLVAAGVAIEADFLWPNGARSIYVRDPAGNSIELTEPALWSFDPAEARRRSITLAKYASRPPPHASQAPCLEASPRLDSPRRDPAPSPWRKCAAYAAARERAAFAPRVGGRGGANAAGLGPGARASPPQRHPIAADLDPREAVEVGHAEKRGLEPAVAHARRDPGVGEAAEHHEVAQRPPEPPAGPKEEAPSSAVTSHQVRP